MAWGRGTDVLCAIATASTWGTSVLANTTDKLFRALSWTATETMDATSDKSYNADAWDRETTGISRIRVSGTFSVDLKYEGLEIPLAQFMGTAGTPAGGGSPYTHTYYRKNNTDGVFATLCMYDGIKTHEFDSVKITGCKIVAKAGTRLTAEFTWIGRRRQENTGTNASLSSATEDTTIAFVEMLASTTTCQIVPIGSALAALEINTWELDLKREYDDDDRAFSTTDAPWRREPVGGACTGSLSVTRPYDATTEIALLTSGALYKAVLSITTGASAIFAQWLPSMRLESYSNAPTGKGGIPLQLSWRLDKAVAAPSTFAQTVPHFVLTNTNSADPLA